MREAWGKLEFVEQYNRGQGAKPQKSLDYSQNNPPLRMGLNAVGSAPSLVQNFFQIVSAKNRTKGERGEGANRTFAQLPQSATRCRTTMGNMGEESEEKTVGERGERPVFVGFSNFPPSPKGFSSVPCENNLFLIDPSNNCPHDKSIIQIPIYQSI